MKIALAALVALLPALSPVPATDSGVLVVLNKSDANVSLLDGKTGEALATLPVGAGPHEAATSPDGTLVVVCNYGEREPGSSLTVIDAHERKVVRTIDLGEYQRPHGIAFLPKGQRVVVTCEVQKKLVLVDVVKGEVIAAIDTEQEASHMVALAPDAARAYVANIGSGSISVIDIEQRKLVQTVPTGAGCEGIATHPESGEIWATNRAADSISIISAETLEVVETIECGSFPIRIAFTPNGERALVSCAKADRVEVYDSEARTKLADISMTAESVEDSERKDRLFGSETAQAMPIGILVHPSGTRAFIANTMADRVTVIDLVENVVLRRFEPGRQPDGMCWIPVRELAAPAEK